MFSKTGELSPRLGQHLAQDPRVSSQSWLCGRAVSRFRHGPPPQSQRSSVIPASPAWCCRCRILTGATSLGETLPDSHGALPALCLDPGDFLWSCLLLLSFFCSRAHIRKVVLREARNQCNQVCASGREVLADFLLSQIYPSPKGQTTLPNVLVTTVLLATLQRHGEAGHPSPQRFVSPRRW